MEHPTIEKVKSDSCERNLNARQELSYPQVLLGLNDILLAYLLTDQTGHCCLHPDNHAVAEDDCVEDDGLSGLGCHSKLTTHNNHDLEGNPFKKDHER